MDTDTYLFTDIQVNDIINLGSLVKEKGMFGRVKKETHYTTYFVMNVTDEIITVHLKYSLSPRMAVATRKKLKELFDKAYHVLVTRPKVVNDELEMIEIINETKNDE